jgi:hypothetical protein
VKLIYNGPHDAVEVELPDGSLVQTVSGEPAEFPEEVAKSLLQQSTWSQAKAETTTKKAQKAEEDDK